MGKPSPVFFHSALRKIGADPNEPFYMLGDDLTADILAGQDAGGESILILTGKTSLEILEGSAMKPDHIVEDLNSVVPVIQYKASERM